MQSSVDADLLGIRPAAATAAGIITSRAGNQPSRSLNFYTEKAHTRVSSLLKVVIIVFTFKNLLRHYPKQALTHGKIVKLRTSQRFVSSCSCHCCRIISKTGCGMDPTSLAFFPQSLTGMPPGYSRLIDSVESGNNLSDEASPWAGASP